MSPLRKRVPLAALAGLSACLLLGGCRTIQFKSPIAATGEMHVGVPVRAWEVVQGERERVGMVVLFEGSDPREALYMVRNVWHQDLGIVDSLGRAYRYLPHHKEPAWVGSGTVESGIRRILALEDCHLFEVPFREIEPDLSPGGREQRRADRAESRPSGL